MSELASPPGSTPAASGRGSVARRRAEARDLATAYDGVLSRRLLATVGYGPDPIAREVRAERWVRHGRQTIALHTGPLGERALRWRAVWEVGRRIAAVDGVTALQAAGLRMYEDDAVHVSVVHRASVRRPAGVVVHKLIRRAHGEVIGIGLPRVRPAVAAIRAAHWARSDRQAALVLAMVVQQRIVTAPQLSAQLTVTRGRTRRRFIAQVIADLTDGAQSLGELDFAQLCRRRGLAEPSRQVVRTTARGRIYLDARWDELGLVVEIDGSAHRTGLAVTDDNLRQNAVTLGDDRVLRIDLLGLRLRADEFMDQLSSAHWQLSGQQDLSRGNPSRNNAA